MDRHFRQCAAGLALGCGLLAGCGQPSSDRSPAAIVHEAQPPPPQLFCVAGEARPMPSPHVVTVNKVAIPVQAQFAQPDSQPPAASRGGSVYAPAAVEQRPAETHLASLPQTATPAPPQVATTTAGSATNSQSTSNQLEALNRRAANMAQKGMLFAARNELIGALQLFAQSLDARHGEMAHSAALSAGLTALREADDFSLEPGRDPAGIRTGDIARGHKTTLLHAAGDIPPAVAQQHYFAYAQQQLTISVAADPAASGTLYLLGKIQSALPGAAGSDVSLAGPHAMVWFQAALAADSRNHLAANELGVLLARYGQLASARQALLHSISIQPQVATWHNLAVVHQRLGETELARLAENERRLLASQGGPRPARADEQPISWVDAGTFAASKADEDGSPLPVASQPATTARR